MHVYTWLQVFIVNSPAPSFHSMYNVAMARPVWPCGDVTCNSSAAPSAPWIQLSRTRKGHQHKGAICPESVDKRKPLLSLTLLACCGHYGSTGVHTRRGNGQA